jgi:hypothetical protein
MFFRHAAVGDIARFEVQERPYEFVRFDGVRFEAPKVRAYAGQEGLDHAVDSPIGKAIGVLKSTKDGGWTGSVLYAADGTRWRDPGQELAGYEYGIFDPWNHPLDNRWSMLIEPNQELSESNTPTSYEVYAADSPDGPKKEELTSWNEVRFRAPMTEIGCLPTKRPYIRVEIRVGGGTWTTLETIPVTDRMRDTSESGSPGSRVLEVFFNDYGAIRIWQNETEAVRSKSRWRFDEQRIRAIAHLRDGTVADLNFNMAGFSGTDPKKNRYHGLEYTRQANGTHVQSGAKSIDMKDIASFELQAQDLKPAPSILLHSPVD